MVKEKIHLMKLIVFYGNYHLSIIYIPKHVLHTLVHILQNSEKSEWGYDECLIN